MGIRSTLADDRLLSTGIITVRLTVDERVPRDDKNESDSLLDPATRAMKTKTEVQGLIQNIADPNFAVGMDPVYVHALILDRLLEIERRLDQLEAAIARHEEE
jgi:hypothetical protein